MEKKAEPFKVITLVKKSNRHLFGRDYNNLQIYIISNYYLYKLKIQKRLKLKFKPFFIGFAFIIDAGTFFALKHICNVKYILSKFEFAKASLHLAFFTFSLLPITSQKIGT